MVQGSLLFWLLRWRGRGNSNSFMLLLLESSTLRLHNPWIPACCWVVYWKLQEEKKMEWGHEEQPIQIRMFMKDDSLKLNIHYEGWCDGMGTLGLRLRLGEYCLRPLVYYILVPLHTIIISDIVQKEKCQTKWEKCLSSNFLFILGKDVFRFIKYTSYVRSSSWRIQRWWANLI